MRKAALSAVFGYLHFGFAIVTGIFLVPLTLYALGARTWGLWLASSEVLAYAGMVDLGILSVLPWLLAEAEGRRDRAELSDMVSQGLWLATCVGLIYAVVALLSWQLLPTKMFLTAANRTMVDGPLAVLVLGTAITYPLRVYRALLAGMQDVFFNGVVTISQTAIRRADRRAPDQGIWFVRAGRRRGRTIAPRARGLADSRSRDRPGHRVARVATAAEADAVAVHQRLRHVAWRPRMAAPRCQQRHRHHLHGSPGMGACLRLHRQAGRDVHATHLGAARQRAHRSGPTAWRADVAIAGACRRADDAARAPPDGGSGGLRPARIQPRLRMHGGGSAVVGGLGLNALLAVGVILGSFTHGLITSAAIVGNRPRVGIVVFVNGLIQAPLAIVLGHRFGLIGVAWATVLAAAATSLPGAIALLRPTTSLGARGLLTEIVLPWTTRTLPFAAAAALVGSFYQSLGLWLSAAAAAVLCAAYSWQMRTLAAELPLNARATQWLVRFKVLPSPLPMAAAAGAVGDRE